MQAQNVRRIEKYTTTSGESATIPSSNDHTDGTWIPTDIYEGELFINLIDGIVFTREGSNIIALGRIVKTQNSITVTGQDIGGYSDGDIIPIGTNLETILKTILTTVIPAVYVQPTASIVLSGVSTTVEVGEEFDAELTVTFNQNDAGSLDNIDYLANAVVIESSAVLNYTHLAQKETIPTTITYKADVEYLIGPQKNDNLGNPSGIPIAAGTISTNSISIKVRYKTWYQKNIAAPLDSTEVRSMTSNVWDNVNTINIAIVSGDSSVCFVIPPNKTLDSVMFQGTLTVDQTSVFQATEVLIDVTGADGNNPVTYKMYRYEPSSAFGSSANYEITLS
ncbi:MAG: hypothetical protein CL843_09510 [Crocinitomicaceae bacterium]|nr:hypothetical protein [Crocinitomicaceae bacterium]|tara:strand:+ start:1849 stop:2856 length:1008 start_codon:yes stop_codon:yes gene_type:complete